MTDKKADTKEETFELVVGDTNLPMSKNKKGQFVVSKKDYTDYLDKEGVTKEVMEKISTAEEKLFTSGYKFLGAEVVAKKEDQSMKIGSGDRTLTLAVAGEKSVTNPQTGAKSTIYGSCSLRERRVLPTAFRNSDMLKEIEADITAAFK